MKKLILLFAITLSFSTVFAQENENAPKIQFEEDNIDYGTIDKGADGVKYFVFTNEGKEPLIISNIRSSCGCTVPTYQKTPIGPGEESKIEVKYDTKRVGPFRKSITVYSNASESRKVLTIQGKVVDKNKA